MESYMFLNTKFYILHGCLLRFCDACYLNFPKFHQKICLHASMQHVKTLCFFDQGKRELSG